MAALLVGLSVMAVMMTAALPVWTHMMQREKEAELIWRGEQYKRAIMLFQRKYANTFPPTLDLLVEQKFLRKKYKDPVTGEDFQIIPVGGQAQPGMSNGRGLPGQQVPGQSGQQAPGQQQPSSLSRAAQQQTQAGQQQAALGIQGVTSKSTKTSIKLYNGRDKYNEWLFVYVAVAQRPGGIGANQPGQQMQPGMGGAPGQRVPGQTPFGQGGFGPGGMQPGGFGQQPGGFGQQPGGFGQQPGGFGQQPGGFGQQPGGMGQQPGQNGRSPFSPAPGGSPFQPVNPGGPQPTRPGVPPPGGFGTPVRPPGI